MKTVYAHSLKGHSEKDWQTLEEHSRNVADLAAEFAAPFGSSEAALVDAVFLGTEHFMDDERNCAETRSDLKKGPY